ncbi:hypothetical protein [Streptomyces sp. NPDC101165]|uniref:hypothetical protein n=1 Tax=Streptomyces sp. NPDC101165 TaxID=3366119 RepID=UPI0037F5C1D6
MITLHRPLDALLLIAVQSDVHARTIAEEGRSGLHRYYRIEGGTHGDSRNDTFPDRLLPVLPCYRTAFTALTAWGERGGVPPPSGTVPRPGYGDPVNTGSLT